MAITTACRVLKVSRSGYYDWLEREAAEPCGRARENAELAAQIAAVHEECPAYGSPRVHRELVARQCKVGRHRVARLMRVHGIRAKRGRLMSRRRAAPPARRPEVVDLVRRRFVADGPNRLWCTDITQIRTAEGWLCAAVVIDVYSRMIISWSVAERQHLDLALDAIDAAIKARRPQPGGVVHSDRGYQFTSWEWLARLDKAGLLPSIGAVGTALDNALMESWFSSFKTEALYPYPQPATRAEARTILFRHIDFHNRRRLHSSLGYQSPLIYEQSTKKLSV